MEQVDDGKSYFLVTGSRDWTDYAAIESELKKYSPDKFILVHGGAMGADMIADYIWKKMKGKAYSCTPDYKLGRAAPLIRNEQMTIDYKIDSALAFCLRGSSGTMHMICILNKKKIPVVVNMVWN